MQEKVEYVIEQGGLVLRRCVSESAIDIPDTMMRQLAGHTNVVLRQLFPIVNWGDANASINTNGTSYWTIPVQRIVLRARFKTAPQEGTKKILVPNFGRRAEQDDKQGEPPMELIWQVPDGMRIVMLLQCNSHGSGIVMQYSIPKMHLFAVDSRPEYWKLPLPNIFEDGSVCEGRKVGRFRTVTEAIADALTTFDQSVWNADLWEEVEKTQAMFRFESKGDKFVPLPPTGSWITLCRKVVVALQSNIVL